MKARVDVLPSNKAELELIMNDRLTLNSNDMLVLKPTDKYVSIMSEESKPGENDECILALSNEHWSH